ncbi:GNAT family N-acetyltransferase [Salinarimonas rosea]|uniref:GNAT family N-acetyltransferase n=1 Tax=Salinarimonas rosea TaxID=552063 RepID=UPI0003F64EE9|nr:GNAT family N-acetyltransferase [Salinarimonas rosea]
MPPWRTASKPLPVVAPLLPAHAPACAAIHAASFAHGWSPTDIEGLISDRGVVADGLYLGDPARPKGFVLSRSVVDEAEILTIALDPAVRGRGLSRGLLERHLEALRRMGVARLHLEVDEANAPARALYARLGFARVGRREGYYQRPDGTRAAALTLALDL